MMMFFLGILTWMFVSFALHVIEVFVCDSDEEWLSVWSGGVFTAIVEAVAVVYRAICNKRRR